MIATSPELGCGGERRRSDGAQVTFPSSMDMAVGTTFGGYRITGVLGRGGHERRLLG